MENKNNFDIYQIVVKNIIIALTDMTKILGMVKVKDLEETIQHMAIALPNIRNIPATTNLEALQKTIKNMSYTLPSLAQTQTKMTEESLQKLIENMIDTTTSMINTCAIRKGEVLQKTMEDTKTTILKVTEIFPKIDWENFKPTDKDMKKAQEILSHEDINRIVFEKLNEQQDGGNFNNSFKIVVLVFMLLYHTMTFISDAATITVKECVNNQIIPIVESIKKAYREKKIESEQEAISQLNQELMDSIPSEITDFFMIVMKDNLPVHQGKEINSKIIGVLDFIEVTQCIEREEDWTHILYVNLKSHEILDGWVSTKHLQKIK